MSLSALIVAAVLQAAPPPPPLPMPPIGSADRPRCSPLFTDVRTLTLRFDEGSAELPKGAKEQLIELFAPVAGNPLAEVEVGRYYPYGVREQSDPAILLSNARFQAVERTAVSVGISEDLVGGRSSAIGQAISNSPGRTDTVDLVVKVKTECHPLADLARRLNPYD